MNEEQQLDKPEISIDIQTPGEIVISSKHYSVKCDSNRRLYVSDNKGIFNQFDDIPKGFKRQDKIDGMMKIIDGLEQLHSSETPPEESVDSSLED